jgi:hypothetical protein
MPSIGACCTLLTIVGSGMPAASSTVGARSITWQNCERISPYGSLPRSDESCLKSTIGWCVRQLYDVFCNGQEETLCAAPFDHVRPEERKV